MSTRLDKIKEILVYLVIVFLPVMSIINIFDKVKINMALSDLFAAIIIALVFIDYKNFSLRRNFPYWWYFAGIMGLMIMSNTLAYLNPRIVSGSILSVANELIKFATAGVYFFIGCNCLVDKERLIRILRVWTFTTMAVSLLGIVIMFNTDIGKVIHHGTSVNALRQRLMGSLTDPNLAAAYLSISFFIAIIFSCISFRKSDKYIGILSLISTTAAIVLTQSRSGIIAFIVSLLLYGAININKLYRYITIFLFIIVIGYFTFLNIDALYFNKQLNTTMHERIGDMIEGKGEADRRVYLAKAAYLMGRDHALLGIGRGNFTTNSSDYFEKLGISTDSDYYKNNLSNLIPHNTYMTFFAELGVLGLLLFLTVFYKTIKLNIRNDSISIALISLLVFYLVQATAVNLENFRVVWFLLGISCIYGIKLDIANVDSGYILFNMPLNKIYLCNMVLFALSGLLLLYTATHYTNTVLLDKKLVSHNITNLLPNEEYVFRYYIKSDTSDLSKPSSRISIYGVDKYEKETMLNSITHYAPNGFGNLVFRTDENISTIKIKAEPLNINSSSVTIDNALLINRHSEVGQRVFANYKFIPDNVEQYITTMGIINNRVKVDIISYKLFADKTIDDVKSLKNQRNEEILYFDGNNSINLSNKLLLIGANLEQHNAGQIKLSLSFMCVGEINEDYSIWMHGSVFDKGLLTEKSTNSSFFNWDHKLVTRTSEWQTGKLYTHEYIINVKPGQYHMSFGLWNPNTKDESNKRLEPNIDLGWIHVK